MLNAKKPFYTTIPQSTIDSLIRYAEKGTPTGGFLWGVLTNNFSEAVGRADNGNRAALYEIHLFVYNEMPADSWGSPQKVNAWIDQGGLEGIKAKEQV